MTYILTRYINIIYPCNDGKPQSIYEYLEALTALVLDYVMNMPL